MKNKQEEKKMRVSFDLDEVLFVNPDYVKAEPALSFPYSLFYKERLRLGTAELINALQDLGYEVWVYTSSYRSIKYISRLFSHYGVYFDGIVNAERHLEEVQKGHSNILPQKVPSRYGIALHVDDESVICSYGREYGFDTYRLDGPDDEWKEKVIARCADVKKKWDRINMPADSDKGNDEQ